MAPKFSIIIPTFNRQESIHYPIDSILKQSEIDWELILIDDGSDDQTGLVVIPYLKDNRINYFSQANSGVCSARNAGAEHAIGDYLIFLDSDDQLELDALSNFKKLLEKNPEQLIFQAGYNLIDSSGALIKKVIHSKSYMPFLSGAFMMERSLFLELGGYDINLKFSENTDLQHRIQSLNFRIVYGEFIALNYLDQPYGGSKNLRNSSESIYYLLKKHDVSYTKHVKGLYWKILGVNHLRFCEFEEARNAFFNSLKYNPLQPKTLTRLLFTYFPVVSKLFYKELNS